MAPLPLLRSLPDIVEPDPRLRLPMVPEESVLPVVPEPMEPLVPEPVVPDPMELPVVPEPMVPLLLEPVPVPGLAFRTGPPVPAFGPRAEPGPVAPGAVALPLVVAPVVPEPIVEPVLPEPDVPDPVVALPVPVAGVAFMVGRCAAPVPPAEPGPVAPGVVALGWAMESPEPTARAIAAARVSMRGVLLMMYFLCKVRKRPRTAGLLATARRLEFEGAP